MRVAFWILIGAVVVCVINYTIAHINRNYRKSDMWVTIACVLCGVLLSIAVLCNKGLVSL